jgi:spore germination protein (amino acid permease)
MNRTTFNDITLLQYIFAINGIQIGIGVLTLPREIASVAGTSGWISIIFGWIISILASFIIITIMKQHPNDTIFDLLNRYFGKYFGRLISIVWICYFAFASFLLLTATIRIMVIWVLPETLYFLLAFLVLVPWVFIARNGLRIISRYTQLVFFLTLWMPMILLISLKDATWLNLLPVIQDNWKEVFVGVKTTMFSYFGFEVAFILYPFLKNKERAYLGIFIANTITLLVFLQITVSCFVVFSLEDLNSLIWPTLSLLKPISFQFLERLEIVFLSAYLFQISTTGIPFLYFTTLGISQIIGWKDHQYVLYVFAVLLIIVTLIFNPSYDTVSSLGEKWAIFGIWLILVFPPILLMYMYVKNKWKKKGIGL